MPVLVLLFLAAGRPAGAAAPRERRVATPADLASALKDAQPGDTLVLADGEWKDADLLVEGQGAAGKPITVRAQTPGKVILTGASRLSIGGSDVVVEGLYFRGVTTTGSVVAFRGSGNKPATRCRLTRCALVGCNPPDPKKDSKWISLYGSRNRVDHCYLAGKTNAGTTLVVWLAEEPNDHQVDHNHFGPRPRLGQNGGETIRVGTSDWSMHVSRTVVEDNLFEQCDGEIEVISNKSCENVYRRNTFRECSGALTLRHGNRCLVAGNWFVGKGKSGSGGVRVIGEDHRVVNNYFADLAGDRARSALSLMNGIPNSPLAGYYQVKRALIAFNTFVNCKSPLAIGVGDGDATLPPEECAFANNLVVGQRAPLIHLLNQSARLAWQGNLCFGATLGIPAPSGIRASDPRLRQAPDGLWRPAPGSPALAAAEGEFPDVTEDIEGQPRPAKKDVGCDQASGSPARSRPLTAADVGPEWLLRQTTDMP